MKERLKKEYNRRLRMILKSELNAKNKTVIPVLRYSFGIINWKLEEIKKSTGKLERYKQFIKCITQKLI
jgi:hypothetical protein